MSGYTVRSFVKGAATQSVGASATATVVSEVQTIGAHDSLYSVTDVEVSGVAITTGITATLYDSMDGTTWNSVKSVTVTATAEVQTATYAALASTAHSDYMVISDTSGTTWAVAASTAGVAEVTTITAVADVSDSLDGTYFLLQDVDGSVAFWIDTDNSGTSIPSGASAADRAIEITTIATDDTAATIGGLLRTAVGADSKFTTSGAGADCIVTNVDLKTLTDAADGDSGFAFVTDTQGADLGAVPTGANWVAADNTAQADISAATDAASVAAAFELAFDGLTGFTAVVVTSDAAANGTMTFTAVVSGPDMAASVFKNTGDTGAGSISVVTTTDAAGATGVFSIRLLPEVAANQTLLPLRPLVRVAVTTGAGDAIDVTAVRRTNCL